MAFKLSFYKKLLDTAHYSYNEEDIIRIITPPVKQNNMGKVILLSRVSTQKQTLEQQTNVLIKEAHHLGYKDKDMIIIEDKESAISLDEQERHGLNKLKEHINNDKSINCVICYEISRLSRRPKVLYSIRDFLIERKIQLVITTPYMRLLEEDGTMSQTASIMFSLFSSLSESEMMIKKERMNRGRIAKMKQNIFVGGYLAYGYKVDETRHIAIDEEQAKIVKLIFKMYIDGYSIQKIYREFEQRGTLTFVSPSAGITFIHKVLKSTYYYGDNTGLYYNYEPIISKETFDKARKQAEMNKYVSKSITSMVYYGKKLIYNKEGFIFRPNKSMKRYIFHNINSGKSWHIGINAMDSLIWHIVKEYVTYHKDDNDDKYLNNLKEQIEILDQKITTGKKNIQDLHKQIDRIEERIIVGRLDDVRGNRMEDEINNHITETEHQINNWMYEREEKSNTIIEIENGFNELRDLNALNDEEIKELIDKTIDKIIIAPTGKRGTYTADFIFKNGMIQPWTVCSQSKYPKYWNEYNEKIEVENLNRFGI